jgi:hypothetical protein
VTRLAAGCLAAALLVTACTAAPDDLAEEPGEEAPDDPSTAPLTGIESDEDLGERPLLITKIDNSPPARPQSGLDVADVVFEELVEGGVTRFIALVHSELPRELGPVRSARPVDVELASGYAAAGGMAYSGARDEVQERLRRSPLVLLTEGQPGFFRTGERRAPHNLYLRTEDAVAELADRGATPPADDARWRFESDPPDGATTCPDDADDCVDPGDAVTVEMSTSFRTGFTYDPEAEVYRREQNGAPMEVTGEGRVGAANVVVLATEHYVGGCCDTAGNAYDETRITGEGRAVVLRDGRWYEARWEKADATAPLRLLGDDGEPFPLKPGRTWVLLPSRERVPDPSDA